MQVENQELEEKNSEILPFAYILYTKSTNLGQEKIQMIGFKRSYKAALRAAKHIEDSIINQLPLGTHKYWWKSVEAEKCPFNVRKFILYSQPYNNLMVRSAVEYVLYVERVEEVDIENMQFQIQAKIRA
jgi:hypothetical protein